MITENYKLLLPYNLQFFAKDGPGGEKTEPATNKKLDETRKQGQVAKSKDLIMAATLMALFIIVKVYVSSLGQKLMDGFKEFYSQFEVHAGSSMGYPVGLAASSLQNVFMNIISAVFPVLIVAVIIAVLGNMLQQRWMVTSEPMKPKFSKLSPVNGFKRIFSVRQLFELLKSIAMIIVIGIIVYTEIKDKVNLLLTFYNITLYQAIGAIGEIIVNLGIKISAVFLVIGFIDLFYQRYKFKQDTMMTKQEIKDEFKNAEGDPQVKGQIRRRMQEISRRRRMMQQLPQADVVITNPTHYAVALKYDAGTGTAPVLVAKGADLVAQRIKEIAKENHVEIVENKPLARMIYTNVEIGREIPPELYQAVAEILAAVYRAQNRV